MSDSHDPVAPDADDQGPRVHGESQPAWTAPASWAPPVVPPAYPQPPEWRQPGWQQPTWQQQGWPEQGWPEQGWQQSAWQQPAWQQSGWDQQGRQQVGSAAWTPPPKPGLFPLRPLPFGTLFGTPFRVLRHNPRATVGGALIVQLISTFATVLVVGLTAFFAILRISTTDQSSPSDVQLVTAGSIAMLIAALLVSVVISLIGTALVQGLVASEVSRGALGERLTLRALWRATRGRRWRLIGWTVLLAAAVTASFALVAAAAVASAAAGGWLATVLFVVFALCGLAAVWIWIGTKTALTPSVIVIEKATVFAAVARSWRLTQRSFWRTFGTLALVAVVCAVASSVVTIPLQTIYYIVISVISPTGSIQAGNAIVVTVVYYVISLIIGTLIGSVTAVVEAATATTVYLDLRMRREGLDADLRRVVDERAAGIQDAGDPFSTPVWAAARP
ncbi:hypothetical protein GCM10028798_25050 [Humibacter antri]